MIELVFFLEEASAQAMLEGLLPRILPQTLRYRCVPFNGKQDLEKNLPIKLRGWLAPNTHFIVLRDKDAEDCVQVKQRLVTLCKQAGKPNVLVRIICTELESWYLGDLQAVEAALGIAGLARQQNKEKFRNPDARNNPKQILKEITKQAYQERTGSRAIGSCLHTDPAHNTSHSYGVFLKGVQRLVKHMEASCPH